MKRLSMPGFLAVCFIVILINMNINSYLQIRALDNIANLISESSKASDIVSVIHVENQQDGDTVVEYSDGSSILYNHEQELYIMWIPETEDLEHCYDSYDQLMYVIEAYHNR